MRGLGWVLVICFVGACVGGMLLITSGKREAPVEREPAKSSRTVQARGVDAGAARMGQLLEIARQEAKDWQADVKLVTVRVLPKEDGRIDLMQAAPGADFLFWSDRADNCVGVMFRSGGEIRPYANAEPVGRRELPESFMQIEAALAQAHEQGWNQRVNRAVLSWHEKKGFGGRYAWTIVGDGSVADDRVYCVDAVSGRPFMAVEIEEFLESPRGGDRRWLSAGKVRVLRSEGMNAMWQVVDVQVEGMAVTVPVRALTDPEREKSAEEIAVGPVVKMTAEQRRVFRSVFGSRAIEVKVEPFMVLSDVGDRERVARVVEAHYAKMNSR